MTTDIGLAGEVAGVPGCWAEIVVAAKGGEIACSPPGGA
jgi:hypothetical protein